MSSDSKLSNQHPTDITKVDDNFLSALALSLGRIFPAILNAAVELNLFEIIAKSQSSHGSSLSASEIASLLPNQHPQLANRLERILPVLASNYVLNCSIRTNEDGKRERVYALSAIGKYFTSDDNGGSLGPISRLAHRGYHDVWKDVKDAIVDTNNNNHFEAVHGMPIFQSMKTNTELNDIFNNAMAHFTPLVIENILNIYKGFEGVSTLVDVGGGVGQTLKLIISKYPSIKGINFDLLQVIQNAPPHPGMEHVAGDMFKSVPEGDVILLKFICHNWSDEECVKFLKNCHRALPQHGKVIVLDHVIPEVLNSSKISKVACAIDNIMFLVFGGRERTEKEFQSLCQNSGFSKFHAAYSNSSTIFGVMEFHK